MTGARSRNLSKFIADCEGHAVAILSLVGHGKALAAQPGGLGLRGSRRACERGRQAPEHRRRSLRLLFRQAVNCDMAAGGVARCGYPTSERAGMPVGPVWHDAIRRRSAHAAISHPPD